MTEPKLARSIETWNRKLHMYLGLYFLLFLWIFAISGLFLNHPPWFHSMGDRTNEERPVEPPGNGTELERARDIARQLGLTGEILTARIPQNAGHFRFRVFRPSRLANVDVDLEKKTAAINSVRGKWTSVLENMHTFSGVRPIWGEVKPERDWIVTWLWSVSIDALSVGLLFLVASSFYMWYQMRGRRTWGAVAFSLGGVACAFFMWGLGLIF